jgi:nitric oxide reductase subunit B
MQGLNTTAAHGHGAMFGVYGMLGIGLMLFCLRGLTANMQWNGRFMNIAFWSFNIGLSLMIVFALLPQGLWQTYNANIHGYWFVRSAEFIHSPIMQALVWTRVPGDIIFALGALFLALALLPMLKTSIFGAKK